MIQIITPCPTKETRLLLLLCTCLSYIILYSVLHFKYIGLSVAMLLSRSQCLAGCRRNTRNKDARKAIEGDAAPATGS